MPEDRRQEVTAKLVNVSSVMRQAPESKESAEAACSWDTLYRAIRSAWPCITGP